MSQQIVDLSMAKRIAGLELNLLLSAKILPVDIFHRARLITSGTPIYDINGEVLFYRIPISKGRSRIGYVDIAANSAFRHPLLGVSYGQVWNEANQLQQARAAVQKQNKNLKFDKVQFVAYSFPKLAVQFLSGRAPQQEVLMVEWGTWEHIPMAGKREKEVPPGNFERWSFIDETPSARHEENAKNFKSIIGEWDKRFPTSKVMPQFKPEVLVPTAEFDELVAMPLLFEARELHFSHENTDHYPCFELRGQLTPVWCVAASVQMVLDFYRYDYTQERLAQELGLGTIDSPNGLPYTRDNDVVVVLEKLTNNALNANMNTTPNWSEFVNEIKANRPLISFIPGHSRTVAGFMHCRLPWYHFHGLLVYDPWPPTSGVITRYENFDTNSYRRTFRAELTIV